MKKAHQLLTGETLNLSTLNADERDFLAVLTQDAEGGADYFELLRRVKGPGALPLRGGPITPAIAASVFYRAAHDIVDRVGIDQGYVLAPDVAIDRKSLPAQGHELMSLTEAAEFIGITRPAAHQALVEGRLNGRRVGNAWVVMKVDAERFKQTRTKRTRKKTRPKEKTLVA